jgi:hypothetical protein
MRREAVISLFTAALSLAMMPGVVRATDTKDLWAPSNPDPVALKSEAARMVPVRATLTKSLNSRNEQAGAQFEAKIVDRVKLKDGTELPQGTVLVGTVISTENSTLALRFSQARLKDGRSIPIKATILGLFTGRNTWDDRDYWNPNMLFINQPKVAPGMEMHSAIGADNSGVFIAAKKGSVKLAGGSGISLAIEAQQGAQENSGASIGGADHRGESQSSIE